MSEANPNPAHRFRGQKTASPLLIIFFTDSPALLPFPQVIWHLPPLSTFTGSERFAVRQKLGGGAFGVVYSVFDRKRNTDVALKLLNKADADWVYRFKQEFRSLADVSHPNLASLYELGIEDDRWFLTMELVRGQHLLQYLRQTPQPESKAPSQRPTAALEAGNETTTTFLIPSEPHVTGASGATAAPVVDFDRLADAFHQLALGIAAIHAAGKLHRDIKPSNVLVEPNGRVVILDFGLVTSVVAGDLDRAGTPRYMAPEQRTGHAEPASDWYSMGVMLYEALTGRPPSTDSTSDDRKLILRPAQWNPSIPESLDRLVVRLLSGDPARRPGAERLLKAFGRGAAAFHPPAGNQFIGRHTELKVLRSSLEASRRTGLVSVRVHGDSGIGKSALLRQFLDSAVAANPRAVILSGRCFDRETVPYKTLDGVVDGLSRFLTELPETEVRQYLPLDIASLIRLFPVLGRVPAVATARRRDAPLADHQEVRRRGAGALRELLARIAEARPCVVHIDDLQWGDFESVPLLETLVAEPASPALLLVASYRSHELDTNPVLRALVTALERGNTCLDLPLGELPPEQACELAASLLGEASFEDHSAFLVKAAGGNPFLIDSMARRGSIAGQIGTLPARARELVEVLAVAARPTPVEMLATIPGLSIDPETLNLLRAGRLIRSRSTYGPTDKSVEELETYHDRIREPVAVGLSAERLQTCNLVLARAWASRQDADPETVAIHFRGAGLPLEASPFAAAAALQAEQAYAFERAIRLYQLALDAPLESAERCRLLADLARTLMYAGKTTEAAATWVSAAADAPPERGLDWLRLASEQYLIGGDFDKGLAILRQVLVSAGLSLSSTKRGALFSFLWRRVFLALRGLRFRERALSEISQHDLFAIDACMTASAGLTMADVVNGLDFQARHLMYALRAGEPWRVARAIICDVGVMGAAQPSPRVFRMRDAGWALAARFNDSRLKIMTAHCDFALEFGRCEWKTAAGLVDNGLQMQLPRHQQWIIGASQCLVMKGLCLVMVGDLRTLRSSFPESLREARQNGDVFREVFLHCLSGTFLGLTDDRPQEALAALREVYSRWTQDGFQLSHYWKFHQETEVALYLGDVAPLRTQFQKTWADFLSSPVPQLDHVRVFAWHLRGRVGLTLAEAGDASALKTVTEAIKRLRREACAMAHGFAETLAAGLAFRQQRHRDAVSSLQLAETHFDAVGMRLYAAASRTLRGELTSDLGLSAQGLHVLTLEEVRRPRHLAAVLIPGFALVPPSRVPPQSPQSP